MCKPWIPVSSDGTCIIRYWAVRQVQQVYIYAIPYLCILGYFLLCMLKSCTIGVVVVILVAVLIVVVLCCFML